MFENSSENSIDNELFSNSSPYLLTLEVEKLISPPNNTRKATKFRKNPSFSSPPKPQNAYQGMKMSIGDVSRLASGEWNKQPAKVHRYFGILENLAKDKHNEIYTAYRKRNWPGFDSELSIF
ncbi:19497_t:CDS:2 [Gigaspora margarita]|uniref:19497_t:CDS:1 n=1 Tax=Gigaspora margarita TaxID=4874 RepID=A0ABN7VGB4_GIGMA|nr:19497_t:CDS:2 [Gigaspora margarita]